VIDMGVADLEAVRLPLQAYDAWTPAPVASEQTVRGKP
jgi:hypothetical protein